LVAGLSWLMPDVTMASVLLPSEAASNLTTPAPPQMAASLPPCAMSQPRFLIMSACNAAYTDFTCICTSQPLNAAIGACLAQNCTVVESLRR
ncbi:hypothetical protein LY76DRAFT_528109, partial [Colletotrichum caudatum]